MHKMSYVWRASLLLLLITISNSAFSQSDNKESHTAWIANSLKQIQTIKIGMNRKELLKVFKVEGGISTGTSRRYVYGECPYIKVDVEFEPVEAKEDKSIEYPSDRIIKISKPYLEWSIID